MDGVLVTVLLDSDNLMCPSQPRSSHPLLDTTTGSIGESSALASSSLIGKQAINRQRDAHSGNARDATKTLGQRVAFSSDPW